MASINQTMQDWLQSIESNYLDRPVVRPGGGGSASHRGTYIIPSGGTYIHNQVGGPTQHKDEEGKSGMSSTARGALIIVGAFVTTVIGVFFGSVWSQYQKQKTALATTRTIKLFSYDRQIPQDVLISLGKVITVQERIESGRSWRASIYLFTMIPLALSGAALVVAAFINLAELAVLAGLVMAMTATIVTVLWICYKFIDDTAPAKEILEDYKSVRTQFGLVELPPPSYTVATSAS